MQYDLSDLEERDPAGAAPDQRDRLEDVATLHVDDDVRGPARVRTRQSHWISSLHYTFDGNALWASLESLDGDLWIAEGEFP